MGFDVPDWVGLWRELVERSAKRGTPFAEACRSERYLRRLCAEPPDGGEPDRLLRFVEGRLSSSHTVLDVGAGAGRWALRLAAVARRVTALEPAPELREALRQRASVAGLTNVDVVAATFEASAVEPHDVVLNSHAMYGEADLPGLVRAMQGCARQACCMVMRLVLPDGVMGELCRELWGQPHDSPNFTIGYNALLGMGIAADVLVDPVVKRWQDRSLAAALERAKRHLYLEPNDPSEDERIGRVLERRLVSRDGCWHWPDGVRSALMWWSVTAG